MKALTIWQPWAALVMQGVKHFETRSWPTNHRGPLAIHAGQSRDRADLVYNPVMWRYFRAPDHVSVAPLTFSAILGIVELVDCFEVQPATRDQPPRLSTTTDPRRDIWLREEEGPLGDFTPGRFAWALRVLEVFEHPIPTRGRQGLWEWTPPC